MKLDKPFLDMCASPRVLGIIPSFSNILGIHKPRCERQCYVSFSPRQDFVREVRFATSADSSLVEKRGVKLCSQGSGKRVRLSKVTTFALVLL